MQMFQNQLVQQQKKQSGNVGLNSNQQQNMPMFNLSSQLAQNAQQQRFSQNLSIADSQQSNITFGNISKFNTNSQNNQNFQMSLNMGSIELNADRSNLSSNRIGSDKNLIIDNHRRNSQDQQSAIHMQSIFSDKNNQQSPYLPAPRQTLVAADYQQQQQPNQVQKLNTSKLQDNINKLYQLKQQQGSFEDSSLQQSLKSQSSLNQNSQGLSQTQAQLQQTTPTKNTNQSITYPSSNKNAQSPTSKFQKQQSGSKSPSQSKQQSQNYLEQKKDFKDQIQNNNEITFSFNQQNFQKEVIEKEEQKIQELYQEKSQHLKNQPKTDVKALQNLEQFMADDQKLQISQNSSNTKKTKISYLNHFFNPQQGSNNSKKSKQSNNRSKNNENSELKQRQEIGWNKIEVKKKQVVAIEYPQSRKKSANAKKLFNLTCSPKYEKVLENYKNLNISQEQSNIQQNTSANQDLNTTLPVTVYSTFRKIKHEKKNQQNLDKIVTKIFANSNSNRKKTDKKRIDNLIDKFYRQKYHIEDEKESQNNSNNNVKAFEVEGPSIQKQQSVQMIKNQSSQKLEQQSQNQLKQQPSQQSIQQQDLNQDYVRQQLSIKGDQQSQQSQSSKFQPQENQSNSQQLQQQQQQSQQLQNTQASKQLKTTQSNQRIQEISIIEESVQREQSLDNQSLQVKNKNLELSMHTIQSTLINPQINQIQSQKINEINSILLKKQNTNENQEGFKNQQTPNDNLLASVDALSVNTNVGQKNLYIDTKNKILKQSQDLQTAQFGQIQGSSNPAGQGQNQLSQNQNQLLQQPQNKSSQRLSVQPESVSPSKINQPKLSMQLQAPLSNINQQQTAQQPQQQQQNLFQRFIQQNIQSQQISQPNKSQFQPGQQNLYSQQMPMQQQQQQQNPNNMYQNSGGNQLRIPTIPSQPSYPQMQNQQLYK